MYLAIYYSNKSIQLFNIPMSMNLVLQSRQSACISSHIFTPIRLCSLVRTDFISFASCLSAFVIYIQQLRVGGKVCILQAYLPCLGLPRTLQLQLQLSRLSVRLPNSQLPMRRADSALWESHHQSSDTSALPSYALLCFVI